jgi:hypothetical protein
MMVKKFFLFFGVFFWCFAVFAQLPYGQNPELFNITQEIPEGMEIVNVTAGHRLFVPKGAKIKRIGAQIIVENDTEYMSRRFEENEQRFIGIEERLETLIEKVANITQEQ